VELVNQDPKKPPTRWSRPPVHFPISSTAIIPLPTGKPKPIPKIQFDFQPESEEQKRSREKNLALIKRAFKHAWDGYRKNAMGHDEVRPVGGEPRDPFMGWGATLVDSLDTLWIMGLKDEFEEAVEATKKIDFHMSNRTDIPLFETVIRYMGGLIGAYDVSGQKYKVLLDKAVELTEVLMGAFDTPNRMPITYYKWTP
jgi:mannosyl-oligosaccharide alpha-1,2-mannosidase